jgi:hypothetical protein
MSWGVRPVLHHVVALMLRGGRGLAMLAVIHLRRRWRRRKRYRGAQRHKRREFVKTVKHRNRLLFPNSEKI